MSQNFSGKSSDQKKHGDLQRYLSFSLGTEDYAIPLLRVKEVVAMPEVTPVPQTPTHFLGIMNLRGQVLSIIDLRLKFRMKKAEIQEETAVIILDLDTVVLGVVVDSVDSVLSLAPEEISSTPDIESTRKVDYISGVAKRENKLVLLLDIAKALDMQDLVAIKQTARESDSEEAA